MPLFTRELNAVADHIGRSSLTIWLHLAAPTEAAPASGRTIVGGGAYEAGVTLAAADISDAANGDISNTPAIDFGTADENVGLVTHWSAVRGADAVAFGTLPNTMVRIGDTFSINAGRLIIDTSTS